MTEHKNPKTNDKYKKPALPYLNTVTCGEELSTNDPRVLDLFDTYMIG